MKGYWVAHRRKSQRTRTLKGQEARALQSLFYDFAIGVMNSNHFQTLSRSAQGLNSRGRASDCVSKTVLSGGRVAPQRRIGLSYHGNSRKKGEMDLIRQKNNRVLVQGEYNELEMLTNIWVEMSMILVRSGRGT